ncbi:MAG: NAD-dependent epimerase/dehydratase family protein [Candidatus Magasanikbacteria bacterium]|nr:NAD-dependent epimerase/dehydratase family protein [Candidatus Magasanikbacteria bacterium]
MRVMVTGANGFVGANLVAALVREPGLLVQALVRQEPGWRLAEVAGRLKVYPADLLDTKAVNAVWQEARPEIVYHLATYGGYPRQAAVEQIFQTTIFGTLNVLSASRAAGVKAIVNVGSSSEYGPKDRPMREDDALSPNTYYGVGKAAQMLLALQFARQEGLPVVGVRIFSAFGPYEEPGRLVPAVIARGLRGEPIEISDPGNARDFLYIEDVVAALRLAGEHPEYRGEIFNVASGAQHTLAEICELVGELLGHPLVVRPGAVARSYDTKQWLADVSQLRSRLGFAPRYSLRAGLQRTIEWFRAHPELMNKYP